ncbi:MAG: hypothetical protein A2W90_02185 [Bacteroidetes bacterium GWF2_42_66]|nr:MAG: hypothetical protein A2W92_16975 [Bacteroidetes bacterium GWA2_42_15]OFY01161.1 MAG: hypothetical protein A2W89_15670 [Bacteroidetes bacterium GWE2_42_39]OFY42004.1 MAG: hypothetical protein A2W90_02185 [Bacteroidetes bacterium GWF2_42_66]HBL77797.1 hypothetical protein [Prolixibacteraceae bacterium]HCR90460.1 hypothetical protein [Prolixibacteraceae bacterium]
MKKVYLVLFVCLTGLFCESAQAQELHNKRIPLSTESNSLNYKLQGKKYYQEPAFNDSKFLTNEWCTGDVVLENGDRYDNLKLRLNSHLDELVEYNRRVGSTIMLDKHAISEFNLNFEDGHTEHFRKISFNKYSKDDRYFSILHEGKLSVLLWYKTIEQKITPYYDKNNILRDLKFVLTKNYYLVLPDKRIVKFTLKNQSFIKMFPEQKQEIRRLFRKNKVLIKSNEEIVRGVKLIEKEIMQN